MTTKNKYFYCFVGQNATTGTPNDKTGRMSYYGDILAFSSRVKRDRYVDNYYNHSNPSVFARKCNRQSAREYNLGMSVHVYNEYMESIDYDVDCAYNEYFGIARGQS